MAAMKILIIKLSAIGDVVQTLPAVEAIKRRFPDAQITWVVEEAAAGILEGHPAVSQVLVSRRKTWLRQLRSGTPFSEGVTGIHTFLQELRSVHYDIAVDFQGLLKSGIIIGLARASRKVGFAGTRELSYLFLNERLPAYDREQHALERYLAVARYFGATDPAATCSLPISSEKVNIRARVQKIRTPGRRLVVVNPVARWNTKLWPEPFFSALADRLIKDKQADVIFTGSAGDRSVSQRILANMQYPAVDWSGATSLKELAALSTLSDLFITTDTGPMHLAAAAGARVLALFGPTAPWRTGPYGQGHIVLRTGIACSPCFKRSCEKATVCMSGISVDDVMRHLPW